MIMKMIAMMLMIPLIARKDEFWMLICGRDKIPAITASSPIIRVVVAVKFLSPRLFLMLWKSWKGDDSIMKPSPRIVSQRVSVYFEMSMLKRAWATIVTNPRIDRIARMLTKAFEILVSLIGLSIMVELGDLSLYNLFLLK